MSKPNLAECLKVLPTDYSDYGGEVKRWEDDRLSYPDCSGGCRFFVPLEGSLGHDWGVCAKEGAPRAGLLTWEHQAGFGCFERGEDDD
jgi:hypothetical protein